MAIKSQYAKILNSMYKKLDFVEKNIFQSLINYNLVIALDRYDVSSRAKFVTYFYYYLKGIPKKVLKEHNHIESNGQSSEKELITDCLRDLSLDMKKILNEQELIVYYVICKRRVNSPIAVDTVLNKLTRYLYDRDDA